MKIYVVDDDLITLRLIWKTLKDKFEVDVSTSAQELLPILEFSPPDFMLVDICMPEMDGIALLRAIRRSPVLRRTKVVLMSSKASLLEAIDGVDHGAAGFIGKPLDLKNLPPFIKNHLNAHGVPQDWRNHGR